MCVCGVCVCVCGCVHVCVWCVCVCVWVCVCVCGLCVCVCVRVHGVCVLPIHNPSMLIPYEQLLIQMFHRNGKLIPEQSEDEHNPLFQLTIDTDLTS